MWSTAMKLFCHTSSLSTTTSFAKEVTFFFVLITVCSPNACILFHLAAKRYHSELLLLLQVCMLHKADRKYFTIA